MMALEQIEAKILPDRESAAALAASFRQAGRRVVFTNGCFDLLHFGHIHYLAEASALGDELIIGLNAQASVSRLKGPHRPIQDEKSRLYQLASLFFVRAVVVFEEDTPLELIRAVSPDVLVKGGDWPIQQIVGADLVKGRGGEVRCLSFQEGYSTSLLEQKIKES